MATKQTKAGGCPCCGGKRAGAYGYWSGVVECTKCKAVYTTRAIYRGTSYEIVRPHMALCEVPADRQRYFDLEVLGCDGLSRRHGWFDPVTRLITQVG